MKCHLPQAISNCPSFFPQRMKWFFPKTVASMDNGCYYIFIHHFTFCSLLGRNSNKYLFIDSLTERWGSLDWASSHWHFLVDSMCRQYEGKQTSFMACRWSMPPLPALSVNAERFRILRQYFIRHSRTNLYNL